MRGLAFAQAGQGESAFVGRVPSTFEVGMMWGTRPLPPCHHLPGWASEPHVPDSAGGGQGAGPGHPGGVQGGGGRQKGML